MLLRQKPKDKDKFVIIDDKELNLFLQMKNFHPKYFYDGVFYYNKTKEIDEIIKCREVNKLV